MPGDIYVAGGEVEDREGEAAAILDVAEHNQLLNVSLKGMKVRRLRGDEKLESLPDSSFWRQWEGPMCTVSSGLSLLCALPVEFHAQGREGPWLRAGDRIAEAMSGLAAPRFEGWCLSRLFGEAVRRVEICGTAHKAAFSLPAAVTSESIVAMAWFLFVHERSLQIVSAGQS